MVGNVPCSRVGGPVRNDKGAGHRKVETHAILNYFNEMGIASGGFVGRENRLTPRSYRKEQRVKENHVSERSLLSSFVLKFLRLPFGLFPFLPRLASRPETTKEKWPVSRHRVVMVVRVTVRRYEIVFSSFALDTL